MMRVMTAQDFIDYDIVATKVAELEEADKVVLPVVNSYMQDEDGNDLYILIDGHHRKAAADLLEIEVEYEEVENEYDNTEDTLAAWGSMGSDWKDVETEEYIF